MPNTQQVSIGRIVHYQAHGSPNGQHKSTPRAAVIAGLVDKADGTTDLNAVDLVVLNPTGLFFNQKCEFDADGAPGTWRWPAKIS